MPEQSVIKRFETSCIACDTWIIAYRSSAFPQPYYLVWYTDNSTGDRLLMYRNAGIFVTGDLATITAEAEARLSSLQHTDKTARWLKQVQGLEPSVSNVYDMDYICNALRRKKLSLKVMDALSNFIDLFGDYANSLTTTDHLQVFREHPVIETFIAHYYQYIFWPRLQQGEKFRDAERPELAVDHRALLDVFQEMRGYFEADIRVMSPTTH
ncbi:hypothetical protein [Chitinophaga barathri]|uniref:Uncharacterized protein n=1 Tax=Chitinophaga barathri TaxID=1647451 RepID=A0A3N4MLL0_9BACT|nr:hypothetical protein [Chitinophaga barathri]RPD42867.1 hypothetical protein EG028_00785 [Chitinophaga barathri]